MKSSLRKTLQNYAWAPLFVALALLLALGIRPFFPYVTHYFFIAAVVACAWKGGRGPGLLTAVVAPLVLDYFFFPPLYTLGFSPQARPLLLPFLLCSLAAAWMSATRRQAREARAKNFLLAAAVEQAPHPMVVRDTNRRIRYINRAYTQMTGYTSEEAIGQTGLVSEEKPNPEFPLGLWETISSGRNWHGELKNRRKDGTPYVEEMTVAPVRDASGKITDYIGFKQDITERKRASEELLYKTVLLEAQSESTLDGIVVADWKRGVTFSNTRFKDMFGVPRDLPENEQGRALREAAFKLIENPEAFLQRIRDLHRKPEEITKDEIRFRDGRVIDRYSSPLKDPAGKHLGRIWYLRDVTEGRRAEERLRKLSCAVEQSPAAVIITDAGGNIEYVNGRFTKLSGYSLEESVGRNVSMLRSGVTPESTYRELWDTILGGKQWQGELINRRKDGTLCSEFVSVSPIFSLEDKITHFVSVKIDMTERKKAEEALRKSEEKYRSLVSNIPDVAWTLDATGRLVFISENIERLTGYTQQECSRRGVKLLYESLDPADAEKAKAAIQALFERGQGFGLECRIRRKDRKWCWLLLRALNTYERDGVRYADGMMADVDASKLAGEEIRAAKEAAESANRAKSQFLANVSHEIRTPMNGVLGMTGLLLDTNLTSEQLHFAETIRDCGESLLQLINDILDFSKIEAEKLVLDSVDFDLQSLVDEVAAVLAPQAHAKGLVLCILVDPQLPNWYVGDPGRLRQVLLNLAGNSVKYTEHGQVVVRVSLEEESGTGSLLRFSVKDTGIGIAEENLGLIFEKFRQVGEPAKQQLGGTGLGLTISKQLAERMGGEIGVSSKRGAGSEFWFTVRLGKGHRPEGETAETEVPEVLKNLRLLVVDDRAAKCEAVPVLTRFWGMRPQRAEGGPQAFQALYQAIAENDPFEIVILDLQPPGTPGKALVQAIMSDPRLRKIRLITVNSLGASPNALEPESSVVPSVVSKPIRPAELLRALTNCVTDLGPHPCPCTTATALPPESAGPKPVEKRAAHILLAEDNLVNKEVALAILKKFGYQASAVSNGLEAIEALESNQYDLVLMDVVMPDLDGIEATLRIRDPHSAVLNHKVPVIALTATVLESERKRCLAAGMNAFLSKPIAPFELREMVEKFLPRGQEPKNR